MGGAADVVARVSQLAAGQWGMLTTAQAEREGITRLQLSRLADAGVLERVERGVYATTSSGDERRSLKAAWLALDPGRTAEERLKDPLAAGVASHTSAAGLHRLGDLLDDIPEITFPHRKQTRRGIRVHRGDLTVDEVTLVDGLPTTTEERTVADLLRDGHDPEHIAQIISQGLRWGVIDLDELVAQVEPLARRHGVEDGRTLVEHLLDLVGLSPTALTRDLAKSVAGQGLIAAGRASAISEIMASLAPMVELSRIVRVDVGELGLDRILKDFQVTSALTQPIDGILKGAFPSMQSAMAAMQPRGFPSVLSNVSSAGMRAVATQSQSPAFRAAIEATRSPAFGPARERVGSSANAEGGTQPSEPPGGSPASERDRNEPTT